MRYLHTMVRVTDLDAALDFYVTKFGLVETRRIENEKGRFTLVFLAAPDEVETVRGQGSRGRPTLELTYNWDPETYTGGRNFGHLAYEVDDIYATCDKLMKAGVTINRPPRDGNMAFIRSPDAISIEILQKGDPKPPAEPWASMQNTGGVVSGVPLVNGVFCLGISTLDYVYSVETMPTRGEKYRSKGLAVVGGGCAGNASVAIARLGGRCWLATRLADDLTGDQIVADLAKEGVETGFARRVAGLRSPVSAILVDAQGERMVISYSDPDMPEDTDWLPTALPQGARAVLADTRWGEGALAALRLARAAGVPGVLDGDRKPPHPDLVATASHVAFSAQALAELSGEDDPRTGLARLARDGPSWLAVTLGKEGVLFVENGDIAHVPAFAVETVDTLGAGDVWHGAFALALAEGQGERAAIRFASAAAAIKCTRFGGRAGAPRRDELTDFLAAAG